MSRRAPTALARHEQGAALLMALIIAALVASMAAGMVWQQWRAVQVESAERTRAQSAWILSGALDWARVIIKEDGRPSAGGVDHLGEPWAVPLAEARLSTFLAVDKENTDDAPDTFLSGSITDAQARYNLRNLVNNDGQIVPTELKTLQRLCLSLNITGDTATRLANGLREAMSVNGAASAPPPSERTPLMPQRLEQLTWVGVDAESLKRLQPYVVLLPTMTPVNINTAPREVLAAVVPGLDLGSADRMVQARQNAPFRNLSEAQSYMGQLDLESADVKGRLSIATGFFIVRGQLRLGNQVLEQRSLVERRQGGEVVPLTREWVNANDPG
jgi:general secretion pathway protein K